ncbi:MAG: TolC family protein [Nitrospinae bacterium]|nr:TolC family protein [Nitrospinota bacterium]
MEKNRRSVKYIIHPLILLTALSLSFGTLAWAAPKEDSTAATGSASPDLSSSADLKTLIAVAFQNNPKLKAAKKRWEAVIEKYPQVTAYEDPVLQYTRFIKKMEGRETQSFGVMQEIPFPGKLSLKGDIVEKEARMAQIDFEKETRDVIVELKDAYYELCYVDKAIEITRKNKDLAEHLARIGETDYSVDGTTLNDVFKAQSQLAQLSYDLVLLTELRETQAARINSILNRSTESPLGRPGELEFRPFDYSLARLYDLAKAHQQELAGSEVKIEMAGKELDLAKKEYLPNFQLGFDYMDMGNETTGAGGGMGGGGPKDAYTFNFGVSLPIWVGKNRARVDEAKLRQEAAVHDKKALENETFSAIKTAYFKLKNSDRLVRLYKDSLIPQAAQSMETAEAWYKDKKGSFSGLLETQSVWLNFNLAQQRVLADFHQGIARMEKLVGVSLDADSIKEPRINADERR